MYRHLLVPLDGSLRAEQALPVAEQIARASAATLILLCVVNTSPPPREERDPFPSLARARDRSQEEEARQYLLGVATSPRMAGLPVIVSVQHGLLLEGIQATIATYQADLLICGEPGEPAGWPGSFAAHLSERVALPLLLLPASAPWHAALSEQSHPLICRVISAGSSPDARLLAPAAALLAALARRPAGLLHGVSWEAVAASLAPQRSVAGSPRSAPASGGGAPPLPKNLAVDQGWSPGDLLVLATPWPQAYAETFGSLRASPCLLIPSPEARARVSEG